MVNRYTKLRVRRRLKVQKKSIQAAGDSAGKNFDKHVVGRWRHLHDVRRFVIGWLVLVALLFAGVYLQERDLAQYYEADLPIAGGTFREGVVGGITNMNPLYATSSADGAASELIFSSLLKYDGKGSLIGDLATTWSTSSDGLVYTVNLRDDVYWHDGEKFDAADVVFTYDTIQHPDTRSFLASSWVDITVEEKSEHVVTFTLPNPFTPFPASLANGGIIPEHILGEVLPSELRNHRFNIEPVGTGPFMYNELALANDGTALLRLDRHETYHLGKPKLDRFVLQTFNDREELAASFLAGEIAAAGGLQTDEREDIVNDNSSVWHDIPLNNGVYVFFKTSEGILRDKAMRTALAEATDQVALTTALSSRFSPIEGPLLKRQYEYSDELTQAEYAPRAANKKLNKLGWKLRSNGYRYKDNKQLIIELVTQSSDNYPFVAQELTKQWQKVGVKLEVLVIDEATIQESHIAPHNYQALLFGISLGHYPDVFPYWHSSQAGINGFNLSEYRDPIVDSALEGGRTRQNSRLRDAKYDSFLEQWTSDMPGIGLYQAGYSYAQRSDLKGFEVERINSPGDRFANVHQWQINTKQGVRRL